MVNKSISQCVSGDCINGEGTYVYSNAIYWGHWADGKRDGFGYYQYEGQQIYEGNWLKDKKHGFGNYYWNTGDRYEGNWIDDKKSGQATYYFSNGDRFVGQFSDNQKTENGTYSRAVDKKGCISGDCINGFGKKAYSNAVYEGYFKGGKEHGKGKMSYASKSEYDGLWENGEKNGKGKMTWYNGDVYDGDWVSNKKQGKGSFYWGKGKWDGDKYDGDWYEDLRSGWGVYTAKNGTIQEGNFEKGVYKGKEIQRVVSSTQALTTLPTVDEYKNKLNNFTDYNDKLNYIKNVIIISASKNDEKLMDISILDYDIILLTDTNINVENITLGKVMNEVISTKILKDGITSTEKEGFKLFSYIYVLCQVKIDRKISSFNQDIVNGILNNYTADTYASKEFYNGIKNAKSNHEFIDEYIKQLWISAFENAIKNPSPTESSNKISNTNQNTSSSNSNLQSKNTNKCSSCQGTGKCKECNKKISKPYVADRCQRKYNETTNPGKIICSTCYGLGFKLQLTSKCDCPMGFGDCPGETCPICQGSGWTSCRNNSYRCDGNCTSCKGTGQY
jgi:hypothetical protein